MLMDDKGDMVAFPVVVMDPTGNKILASQQPASTLTPWIVSTPLSTNAPVTILAGVDGIKHYWMGGFIFPGDACLAVAGQNVLRVYDTSGFLVAISMWLPVAANRGYSAPIPYSFPGKGILITGALLCRLDFDLSAGAYTIQSWGVTET